MYVSFGRLTGVDGNRADNEIIGNDSSTCAMENAAFMTSTNLLSELVSFKREKTVK